MDRPEQTPHAGEAVAPSVEPEVRGWRRDGSASAHPNIDGLTPIIDAISSILIGMDGDGTVTLWNPAAATALGVPAGEAIGRPLLDCGVRWDAATVAHTLSACAAGDTPPTLDDLRYTRPDGREGFLGIALSRYGARDEDPGGILLLGPIPPSDTCSPASSRRPKSSNPSASWPRGSPTRSTRPSNTWVTTCASYRTHGTACWPSSCTYEGRSRSCATARPV